MSTEKESSLATRLSLLARLKDWSQQTAWRDFDRDYAPLVRNVARKAGLTDAEADEAAQETLIAVAKKIAQFQHSGNRGSFRAWLYQQARWRIADQFRLRAKTAPCRPQEHDLRKNTPESEVALPEVNEPPELQADPSFERLWEAEWEEHVRLSALGRVKRRVSARQFQLFELHVVQGLSVRATAEAAGATRAAIYMAKNRVGRHLKRELKALRML